MKQKSFLGLGPHGFHRIAYTEWGEAHNARVLVCVHGLTRTGRDFDALAAALADQYRVLCPDMPGRGASDWYAEKEDYGFAQYCADMAALLARAGVDEAHWLGTSMGGLIGMMLAAQPGSPITRLVMNDIGPFLPKAGLEAIGRYVADQPVFDGIDAVVAYLKSTRTGFGPLTDDQWRFLAEHSVKKREDGAYVLHMDPKIGERYLEQPIEDVNMWPIWDRVRCPVMVIRGGESNLLLAETVDEMSRRGPKAEVREAPGYGHAPPLVSADQIALVRDWLLAEG